MTVKRDIAFSIIANAQDFQKEIAKLPNMTDKAASSAALRLSTQMEKGFKKSGKDAKKHGSFIGKAMVVGVGTALATLGTAIVRALDPTAFITASKEAADFTNHIQDMSVATGISADTLTGLQFMARATGSSLQEMQPSLAGFAKRMHDASLGTGEAAIGFGLLDMSMTDDMGTMRDMNDVFEETLNKLSRMEAGQKRTLASQSILGESGGKLTVAMIGASLSLEEATETVETYGIGTREAIKASAQMQQMTAHYELFAQGVKTSILVNVIPALMDHQKTLLSMLEVAGTVFGAMAAFVTAWGGTVANILTGQKTGIEEWWGLYDSVFDSVEAVTKNATDGLRAMFTGMDDIIATRSTFVPAVQASADAVEKVAESAKDANKELNELQATYTAMRGADQAMIDLTIELADGFDKLALEETRANTAAMEFVKAGASFEQVNGLLDLIQEKYRRLREEMEAANVVAEKTPREALEEWANAVLEVQTDIASAFNAVGQGYSDVMQLGIDKTMALAQAQKDQIKEHRSDIAKLRKDQENAAGFEKSVIKSRIAMLQGEIERRKFAIAQRKKDMRKMFRGQQAASISEAIINGSVAIMKALATLGPVLGPLAASGITASTFAQVETIRRQPPPKFHSGGMADEVPAVLRKGESVLSQGATASLGKEGVDSLNEGRGSSPMVLNFNVGGKLIESLVFDAMTGKVAQRALRPGSISVGVVNPYVGR